MLAIIIYLNKNNKIIKFHLLFLKYQQLKHKKLLNLYKRNRMNYKFKINKVEIIDQLKFLPNKIEFNRYLKLQNNMKSSINNKYMEII